MLLWTYGPTFGKTLFVFLTVFFFGVKKADDESGVPRLLIVCVEGPHISSRCGQRTNTRRAVGVTSTHHIRWVHAWLYEPSVWSCSLIIFVRIIAVEFRYTYGLLTSLRTCCGMTTTREGHGENMQWSRSKHFYLAMAFRPSRKQSTLLVSERSLIFVSHIFRCFVRAAPCACSQGQQKLGPFFQVEHLQYFAELVPGTWYSFWGGYALNYVHVPVPFFQTRNTW